jgi:LacI family transcriptional regulator
VSVSLKDVATRASVSFQTASKVLNGRDGVVSPATRERIEAAARDLGYVPNALARGLVGQASFVVGVLAEDPADPALAQFVVAAQRATAHAGHVTLMVTHQVGGDPAADVRKLREHRVGGILVVAPMLEDDSRLGQSLRTSVRAGVPAISLNHIHGGGVPLVGSDHELTGALAARHLLSLGHKQIGTVTGARTRRVTVSRHRGFRRTLRAAGVPLSHSRVVEANWSPQSGYEAGRRLLRAEPDLTAVFVHTDRMAVGVLRGLEAETRRVPDDCSVMGCDDDDLASHVTPPLSTVHIPFQETGERAADLLLMLMRGEAVPHRELLPVHVVTRSSTGPPKPVGAVARRK